MITGSQVKAARVLLNSNLMRLAKAVSVEVLTITAFEVGGAAPEGATLELFEKYLSSPASNSTTKKCASASRWLPLPVRRTEMNCTNGTQI